MAWLIGMAGLAALGLGGCASGTDTLAPSSPVQQPQTPRPQSVQDWQTLAADVAARLAQGMGEAAPAPAAETAARPLRWHVAAQRPSAFNRAFHALLVHELIQRRVALDSGPADGRIDYEVQLLPMPPDNGRRVEVLVTTTVRVGPRLLQTTADAYAIAQGDLPLYTPLPAPPPATVKPWKVVGE